MKKIGFLLLLPLFFANSPSFAKGKKIEVNGEKITVEDGIYAKFETTLGDILIALNTEKAPMTAANFIMLAEGTMPNASAKYKEKPSYNGLTFHRVLNDFVIQGGCPNSKDGASGMAGTGGPGYQIDCETSAEKQHHERGVLSMAHAGKDTGGSQFFIAHDYFPHLDGVHTVFGKVIEGIENVDQIADVEINSNDKPIVDLLIDKIVIDLNSYVAGETIKVE